MKLPFSFEFCDLPFVLRLVIDPVRALDLLDNHRQPDHTKIIPVALIAATIVLQVLHVPLTVAQMLVLFPAAFGAAMYHRFMRYKSVTANVTEVNTKTVIDTTTRQIIERRDPDEGIDPTHD